MPDAAPAIALAGLTKRFPGLPGQTALTAVDQLSFAVRAGEIFGLVGPDGAGKTTTLRMLAGVLAPDEGTATVAGCDIVREPDGTQYLIITTVVEDPVNLGQPFRTSTHFRKEPSGAKFTPSPCTAR